MELTYADLENGVRKIDLMGRLDIDGATTIDLKFTALAATQRAFLAVDLTLVDFIASLGVATLVRTAKAARLRKGNLVLLNPQPNVAKVLAATRVDQVVPVYANLDEACAFVLADASLT
ncbi:MAG TPA: STAS domain-containing protein [Vicinamibacterales bacterium]